MRALTRLSRRRRHKLAPLLVVVAALGVTGALYTAVAPSPRAQAATGPSQQTIDQGRALYLANCSSCHGLNAEGTTDGPSLIGVGAAAVDFQVATGRMPAAEVGPQIQEKRPTFIQAEIDAMAAYIASLGPGPAIPSDEQVDYADADPAEGGEIYRTNCAMCHNYAGSGGALTRGKFAPPLTDVSARHIYEAMQTGPQSMPVFGEGTMPEEDKKAIIAFLRSPDAASNPGGLSLGRIGPVSEGLVGWIFGLGALVGCAVWLGAKAR